MDARGVLPAGVPRPDRDLGAAGPGVTREEVEQSIKVGVAFLLKAQRPDGTWGTEAGESALVTLALLTAGESPDSEPIRRAARLPPRAPGSTPTHETYTVALMTMAFAAADPEKYRDEIARNAEWLEQAQTRTGAWTYNAGFGRGGGGDNSNTQYALLGLNAASEAGFAVQPEVWLRARRYWEMTQNGDGELGLPPRQRRRHRQHDLRGDLQPDHHRPEAGPGPRAARRRPDRALRRGGRQPQPPARHRLAVGPLRRRPRTSTTARRGTTTTSTAWSGSGGSAAGGSSANNDWYREGAAYLVRTRTASQGFWRGRGHEADPLVTTSFALLFLAKGRAPVLINKLRHGPGADWNNDHDDVTQPRRRRLARLEAPAHLAGRRPQRRDRRGHAPGPDRLLQRPRGPRVLGRGQGPAPRLRRAGRRDRRRGLLRPARVRPGLPRPDEGGLPRARAGAPPPGRGPRRLAVASTGSTPDATRSGGSSTAAGPWSSTRPTTCRATGTSSRTPRATPGSGRPRRSARTSSTTPPAASCPPTSWPSATSPTSRRTAPAGGPPDRQAPPRRRLEHRPAGDPQPDHRAPRQAQVRRGDQPQGTLPPRPEPGPLPPDLPPRPGRRRVLRGGPGRPPPPPRPRRRHPLRRRRLREPRLRRRLPPVRRRADARATPWSRSPRDDDFYTRKLGYDLSDAQTDPRRRRQGRLSPTSKASRSTAAGPSSTPSSTSAAPSRSRPGSTARATPTRAP